MHMAGEALEKVVPEDVMVFLPVTRPLALAYRFATTLQCGDIRFM